jgi:hypothetical protein
MCWCVIFSFQRTDGWVGRVWARTGCDFDGNVQGHRDTGDCGNKLQRNGFVGVPPVTLAEIRFNGHLGKYFFDVSLVDGFNVSVQVRTFLGYTGIGYRFCDTGVY